MSISSNNNDIFIDFVAIIDNKTDLIVIVRPNLCFYRNGAIVEAGLKIMCSFINFICIEEWCVKDFYANDIPTTILYGLYVHFPAPQRTAHTKSFVENNVLDKFDFKMVCDLQGEHKYKVNKNAETGRHYYESKNFGMTIYQNSTYVVSDDSYDTVSNIQIVYNENQNLKSSNLYTVPTINMNAEEKDNLERPIEEPQFNFGLIISACVSGIILITLTIVLIVTYLKKRKDVDKTDESKNVS